MGIRAFDPWPFARLCQLLFFVLRASKSCRDMLPESVLPAAREADAPVLLCVAAHSFAGKLALGWARTAHVCIFTKQVRKTNSSPTKHITGWIITWVVQPRWYFFFFFPDKLLVIRWSAILACFEIFG